MEVIAISGIIGAAIILLIIKQSKINLPNTPIQPQIVKIVPTAISNFAYDGIKCDFQHPTWPKEHKNDVWIFFDGMPELGDSPYEKMLIPIIRDFVSLAIQSAKNNIEFQGLSKLTKADRRWGYTATVLINGQNIVSLIPSLKNMNIPKLTYNNGTNKRLSLPVNGSNYPSNHFDGGLRIGNQQNQRMIEEDYE